MINGTVTANREATIRLKVHGPAGQQRTLKAVIDTGFNRSLSLPPSLITPLGLRWHRRGRAVLADGSECVFDVYQAQVTWDGRRRRILVHEADTDPLVGMALLEGYELNAHICTGGKVTIKPLPRRRSR